MICSPVSPVGACGFSNLRHLPHKARSEQVTAKGHIVYLDEHLSHALFGKGVGKLTRLHVRPGALEPAAECLVVVIFQV